METRQPRYLLEGRRTRGCDQRAKNRASDLNRLNPQAFLVFGHQPLAALAALLSPSARDNASGVDITICIMDYTIHNTAYGGELWRPQQVRIARGRFCRMMPRPCT